MQILGARGTSIIFVPKSIFLFAQENHVSYFDATVFMDMSFSPSVQSPLAQYLYLCNCEISHQRRSRAKSIEPYGRRLRTTVNSRLPETCRASLSQNACLSPQHILQMSCQFMVLPRGVKPKIEKNGHRLSVRRLRF